MFYLAERTNATTSEALHFARDLFGASAAALYRVDASMNPFDYVLNEVSFDFHRRYVEEMSIYDPLHVSRLGTGCSVAKLEEAGAHIAREEFGQYRNFVRRFEISDMVEFVFRRNDAVFAGMCLTFTHGAGLTDELERLTQRIHGYLEFNLCAALPRQDLPNLTTREREIGDLLCCGRTNQDIATCLGIGVATVKTHLIHIFDKLGAENRAAAVALLSRQP